MGTTADLARAAMRTAAVLAVGFVSLLALIQGISQAIAIGQRERALIPLLLGFVPSVLLASLIGQRFRGGEVHPWQFVAVLVMAFTSILLMLLRSGGL